MKSNGLPIGYSRLSGVIGIPDAVLVESVVVAGQWRGKGLGRLLMEKTHDYARQKGFATIYLSTHDKQKFYAHLGYEFCTPVCSESSNAGMNAAIEGINKGR
jgi:N-acetylglutamate synthase-like GNAT family acetyltransferase